jgi:nucleoside-diphosphate-sugar epimerase
MINLNTLDAIAFMKVNNKNIGKVFFSSSACCYNKYNQSDPNNPKCSEDSAYPACPDSEYGFEKLFSERLYFTYSRIFDIDVRVARFHNIFGAHSIYKGGREKAPCALCRKVVEAKNGDDIEIWGDGRQTRSFLYIDECLEGVERFMTSDFQGPLNIGSEEMISIEDLAKMIIKISGKKLGIKYIEGPVGVRGRNSDNNLIRNILKWEPKLPLKYGIERTYKWIEGQYV